MTLTEFQAWVIQNSRWFDGVQPETFESIAEIQRELGCPLSPSMKWLLTERGYSMACGVDSLDESVAVTLRARQSMRLPERYVILNDWQDSGVVFFDFTMINPIGEYKIYWTHAYNLTRLAEGQEIDADIDVFEDYPDWVKYRLEEKISENY